MINVIGIIIVVYASIVSFAGPELTSKGFKNRVIECIDKYRYVLLLGIVGSILTGINI